MQVNDYGPKSLKASGDAEKDKEMQTFWVTARNLKPGTYLREKGGVPLQSTLSEAGDLLTAYLPYWLYQMPGELVLQVVSEESDTPIDVTIEVEESPFSILRREKDELIARIGTLERYKHEQESCGAAMFSGWGMTTHHSCPWNDHPLGVSFLKAEKRIQETFEATQLESSVVMEELDRFRWRFWNVYMLAQHAHQNVMKKELEADFVECGVGDGYTASIALASLELDSFQGLKRFRLFDSWQEIKEEDVLKSEEFVAGTYSNLSRERTEKNLSDYSQRISFHQGYIPEVFTQVEDYLGDVAFLHIDLNATPPSIASLEFFISRMVSGSIILFDDYNWQHYADFRAEVNKFFSSVEGTLLAMPTGQAVFFVL